MGFKAFASLSSLFFCLLFTGLSCSKKSGQAHLTLQFQQKGQSAQSTDEIDQVFVNISSPGRPLQVFEKECGDGVSCSIEMDVDSGNNQLIQLLVITENSNTSVTKVHYGDVTTNLNSGQVSLTISASEIGNFNQEAKVMGRYIPTNSHAMAGHQLTGFVDLSVFVEAGKPEMKLMRTEIFGGWMRLFVLDSVGFNYSFTGRNQAGAFFVNQPILDDLGDGTGLKINSPGLAASSNQIVHYNSALSIYDERDNIFQQRPFAKQIVGFFGQNPDTSSLCSDLINGSTRFDGQDGRSHICKSVDAALQNCTDFFSWSDISVSGSVNGASNSCVGAPPLEMKVDLEQVGEDNNLLKFFGPFIASTTSGDEVVERFDPGLEIRWTLNSGVYLPGGVEVFYRASESGYDHQLVEGDGEDEVFCENLPSVGFVSNGVVTGVSGSSVLPTAAYNHSKLKIALCPRKADGSYFRTAYLERDYGHENIELLEFALYHNDSTPISGYGFGSSGWDSPLPPVMDPQDSTTTNQMQVVIKNKSSLDINLSNINTHPFAGYTVDFSPSPVPSGLTACGSATPSLQPDGAAGFADRCVVQINFNPIPPSYTPGTIINNHFSVDANVNSSSLMAHHGVEFVTPIYQLLQESDTGTQNMNIYAPPGEVVSKYFKLLNDTAGGWTPNFGSPPSYLTFNHNCTFPLTASVGNCIVRVDVNNIAGSITNGNVDTVSGVSASASLSVTSHTNALVITPGDFWDFGSITASTPTQTFTINNNTGSAMVNSMAQLPNPSGPYSISSDTCDSMSIAHSGSCSFGVMPASAHPSGYYHDHYVLPYGIWNQFDELKFEFVGGYQ